MKICHLATLGSMLWSLISAIFANFWRKNWRFSQKPMLYPTFHILVLFCFESTTTFFRSFFAKIFLKIVTFGNPGIFSECLVTSIGWFSLQNVTTSFLVWLFSHDQISWGRFDESVSAVILCTGKKSVKFNFLKYIIYIYIEAI
jgi:hypothetical protein